MPANPHTLTFLRFQSQLAKEVAAEYGITVTEVLDDHIQYGWEEWRDAVVLAVKAGYEPSQAWINSARRTNPEWWERRILHDNPNWLWKMTQRGRSLLVPLNVMWKRNA